jgi:hypothetical protein
MPPPPGQEVEGTDPIIPDDPTPDGKTVYSYDDMGRMQSVIEYKLDPATRQFVVSRSATTYEYDPITSGVTLIDSPEGKLRHEYDAATGRLNADKGTLIFLTSYTENDTFA